MILYLIRHGDPIYDPDSLTPLGHEQAKALAKRFTLYGLDEIYCSTSNRAKLTAQPTCELLGKEMTLVDWANEGHAWNDFAVPYDDGSRRWAFHNQKYIELFNSDEIRSLGKEWYTYPDFKEFNFEAGVKRINKEVDAWLEELGYQHDRKRNGYIANGANEKRVALFAHQGFGLAFLSSVLDIPYPMFSTRFDITTTGVSVLHFSEEKGSFTIPKLLQLSNDSHLYREGLMNGYHNSIKL